SANTCSRRGATSPSSNTSIRTPSRRTVNTANRSASMPSLRARSFAARIWPKPSSRASVVIAEENFARDRVLRLESSWRPQIRNLSLALLSGGLMTLAFPGWEVWVLGWVALAPLLVAIARERSALRSFGLGVVTGTLFFYGTCWFIAFSPIHYGN